MRFSTKQSILGTYTGSVMNVNNDKLKIVKIREACTTEIHQRLLVQENERHQWFRYRNFPVQFLHGQAQDVSEYIFHLK